MQPYFWSLLGKSNKIADEVVNSILPYDLTNIFILETADMSILDIDSSNYNNDIAAPLYLKYYEYIKKIPGVNLETEKAAFTTPPAGANLWTGTKDFTPESEWLYRSSWTVSSETFNGNTVLTKSGAWHLTGKYYTIEKGKTYTFSMYAKRTNSNGRLSMVVFNREGSSATGIASVTWKGVDLTTTEFTRVSITFEALENGEVLCGGQLPNSDTLHITSCKLEEGTEPTPWSDVYVPNPNIEDIVNLIFNNRTRTIENIRRSVLYSKGYRFPIDSAINSYMEKIHNSDLSKIEEWLNKATIVSNGYTIPEEFYVNESQYSLSTLAIHNPLMGYAPYARWGEYPELSMIYIDVLWSELEPTKGNFDFDGVEATSRFSKWKNEGKHAILRFILDTPTDESHADIPQWLIDELSEGAGVYYNTSYGQGFCPNYSNPTLISYYKKAVQAMSNRWGSDRFITYIQLGALGHWGEWHTNYDEGVPRMPIPDIRRQYIEPWLNGAFPNAFVMMRRSWDLTKEYGLGIFNDMMGNKNDTDEWLTWIEAGGTGDPDDAGVSDVLVPMPDIWETQPMGGEFTSSTPMETMLVTNLADTIDGMRRSHTTFIGQKIADKSVSENGYNEVLKNIGYRIWVSNVVLNSKINMPYSAELAVTLQNGGVAPFYDDWAMYAYVYDDFGIFVEKVPFHTDIRTVIPGEAVRATCDINGYMHGLHRIYIGIPDPMDDKLKFKFAVTGKETETLLLVV